jgi:hypothetical protein
VYLFLTLACFGIGSGVHAAEMQAQQDNRSCLPDHQFREPFLPLVQGESVPIFVLKPYNLHLALAGASTGQLHIYDADGIEVTTGLSFFGYDSSLIYVTPTGLVTALRAENPTEIGTWVQASVSGQAVQNTTIVRVLSTNHGIDFIERVGDDSVIYSPLEIDGEDIDQYVDQYEMLLVLDYAYDIQHDLMHTVPFNGGKQVYEVDFGETETSRVCGISGNPVRLGWNLNGNEWTNCFLVPFIPPRSPQWFVITHELGHNVSWHSGSFGGSIGPEWEYSEGIASYLSLTAMRWVVEKTDQYPAGQPALDSLEMDYDDMVFAFMNTYTDWIAAGAPFEDLDPNVIDAILLNQEGTDPNAFAERFFNLFRPEHQPAIQMVLNDVDSSERRHTFFAAACSAAAQQDLYDLFLDSYNYPLDTVFYYEALMALESLPPPFVVFTDGFESGDTSAWTSGPVNSCPINLDVNFDGASIDACDVSVNGVVLTEPGCAPITRIHWRWDDGTENDSWFPAAHTYLSNGTYSVTTTAYDADGFSVFETGNLNLGSCSVP